MAELPERRRGRHPAGGAPTRRALLTGAAGAAGAAATAAVCTGTAAAGTGPAPDPSADPRRVVYRETDHIRQAYARMRV